MVTSQVLRATALEGKDAPAGAGGEASEGGRGVALKQIMRSKSNFRGAAVQRELRVMRALDHPNVVKMIEFFEDSQAVYLVLELAAGGDLYERLLKDGPMREPRAAAVVAQMLDALTYMHARGVCHRDIKPENILMVSDEIGSWGSHFASAIFLYVYGHICVCVCTCVRMCVCTRACVRVCVRAHVSVLSKRVRACHMQVRGILPD